MVDKKLDEMEKKLKDFKLDLTNGRKKGGECVDASKTVKQIPTKINIYSISQEQKDENVVNKLFLKLADQLKVVWTSSADKMVEKIEYFLEIGEMDNVDFFSKQLKEVYPKVEKEEKKRIYDKILDLRGKILKSKKKGD